MGVFSVRSENIFVRCSLYLIVRPAVFLDEMHEDVVGRFLQNTGIYLPDYTASHSLRTQSSHHRANRPSDALLHCGGQISRVTDKDNLSLTL
jgi:hypothetical protein